MLCIVEVYICVQADAVHVHEEKDDCELVSAQSIRQTFIKRWRRIPVFSQFVVLV
jgi:hypothetical protein